MSQPRMAQPEGPFAGLSATFDREEDRQKPLFKRKPIIKALEAPLEEAIALARPDTFIETGAFEAAFSRRMKAAYADAPVVAVEANLVSTPASPRQRGLPE